MKVTIEMPEQRIQDLLCNAFEGGSNYWYVINGKNYPEGQTKESLGIEFEHLELPFKGGSLIVGDFDGDEGDKVLDLKAIKKGLRIMANKHPRHFGDWLGENDDATTGDVFLQCCLFGEVVYG